MMLWMHFLLFALSLWSPRLRQNEGRSEIRFAEPTFIYEIPDAFSAAIVDLNNDGRGDIVVGVARPSELTDHRLRIYYQNEAGEITIPTFGDVIHGADDLRAADVNRDGLMDLATTDGGIGIHILLQQEDGSFLNSVIPNSKYSITLGLADFNNDGLTDVASVPLYVGCPDSFQVFYQLEGARFDSMVYYPLGKSIWDSESWVNIQAADMNSDGLTDIVICGGEFHEQISIYHQQIDGGFRVEQVLSFESWLRNTAIADFSGDGKNDLVAGMMFAPDGKSYLALYAQDSLGRFPAVPRWYSAYDLPITVRPGDFNRDGKADVLVTHYNRYGFTVYPQGMEGCLGSYVFVPNSNRDADFQASAAVGDVNGDNWPDIVSVNRAGLGEIIRNETGQNGQTGVLVMTTGDGQLLKLDNVYPNPFNDQTRLSFSVSTPDHIQIAIYDLLGRNVKTVLDQEVTVGDHSITVSMGEFGSGLYLCRLSSKRSSVVTKLIHIR
jgi:hypothetical protein